MSNDDIDKIESKALDLYKVGRYKRVSIRVIRQQGLPCLPMKMSSN